MLLIDGAKIQKDSYITLYIIKKKEGKMHFEQIVQFDDQNSQDPFTKSS